MRSTALMVLRVRTGMSLARKAWTLFEHLVSLAVIIGCITWLAFGAVAVGYTVFIK